MRHISLICFFVAATMIFTAPLYGQEDEFPLDAWKEAGIPYIQNFSPRDYNGGTQNWRIVQDERGIMYFGNNEGVLSYDGVSWRKIPTDKGTIVRSICLLNDRIYVGGQGEIGYLQPNAAGQLGYRSLLDKIPVENHDFKDTYRAFAVDEAVYFQTHNYIFRWQDDQMQVWKPQKRFQIASVLNNAFYVNSDEVGLMQMRGDSLQLVPGGELFAQKSARMMLQYDSSQILIGTSRHGLFLYDGFSFRPFPTSADDFLSEHHLFAGTILPGGLIALATWNGVLLLDNAGNLLQLINKPAGLRDEIVISLSPDRQGGLWLALSNGIARVEMLAPLSRFKAESGIESYVLSLTRHSGRFYAASALGVFHLDDDEFPYPSFKQIEGISRQSFALFSIGSHLLAGVDGVGLYDIRDTRITRINRLNAESFHGLRNDTHWVFVGLTNGLAAIELVRDQWKDWGRVPDISERITAIAEARNGAMWMGTNFEGVLRVEFDPQSPTTEDGQIKVRVARFGKKHGLPDGQILPAAVGPTVFFATQKGLRRFDKAQQQFVTDSAFGAVFADTISAIDFIREDLQRNVWFIARVAGKQITGKAVPQTDGSYTWQEIPFKRLNDIGNLQTIYPEENGVVWFGGTEGIGRYTPAIPKDYAMDYSAVIRRVADISSDSVFYHGVLSEPFQPELEYAHNSLRFEFAATSYDDPSANQYQVKLEGFDKDWSNWTTETKKDYTGLPARDYTFRVRAKNIYEHLSSEGTFSFTILPPWYQTPWAYLLYTLFGLGILFGLVKGRVRHLEKKTEELETIVAERTTKIREQAEKLKELDHMKSRFFANISHEFRTPLTLILGPLQDVAEKVKDKTAKQDLKVMHRNANRLLQLINQLLDISRLESGKMQLNAGRGDFITLLNGIVMSFASLAEQKKITLNFDVNDVGAKHASPLPEIYFDRDKIEKIFYNLLSNALKFTPKDGDVSIVVSTSFNSPLNNKGGDRGVVQISVKDTGIGIPADRLPHIFDRFYQVDGTSTREHEGTGIGLALTKELVELHYGEIKVHSEEGKGTEFIVRLPVGKEHLQEDEVVMEPSEGLERPPSFQGFVHEAEVLEDVAVGAIEPSEGLAEATIILVVDDHPDVRNYIRKHLEPDYQIIEASDGKEAVDMALETIPDLVISDVMMPQMDGYQLCKALKTNEKTSHIPVILLTAKAGEEDKLAGLETGADDYLTKPFNSKELLVRTKNLIDQRQNLRARYRREGLLQPRDVPSSSVEEEFLQRLMNAIEEHLDDEDFGVETLSERLYMGRRQLHRKIRALTAQTPTDFIRSIRLQHAKKMLEQHAGTVSEIAFQVGFNNLSYFSKSFREEFGKLPSELSGGTDE